MKNPRTIIEALSYWLNFELTCHRQELFNERHMSYPIGQFLISRYGHVVRTEFDHPILSSNKKRAGNNPKVDFVVLNNIKNNEIELAIETKWVSKSNTLARDICRDLIRLSLLLDKNNCSAYLIVAGKNNRLKTLFSNKDLSFFPIDENSEIGNYELFKKYNQGDNFTNRALDIFKNLDIPNSITVKKITDFKIDFRDSQYPVYGWRILKKRVNKFQIKSASPNL